MRLQPLFLLIADGLCLLRNYSAELFAELIDLLEHYLCELSVVCSLVAFRMVSLVLEVVVKLYSLVNYLRNLVCILMRIECYEECAVINEFCYEILDVFLENSKVHDKYVLNDFVIT